MDFLVSCNALFNQIKTITIKITKISKIFADYFLRNLNIKKKIKLNKSEFRNRSFFKKPKKGKGKRQISNY